MANGRNHTWLDAHMDGKLATARMALCITSVPSATVTPPGLTVGGGYTAGGLLIDVDAAVSGVTQGPDGSSLVWTNSSGISWPITGLLVHTAGLAHPTAAQVLFFNTFASTVPNGGALTFAVDSLTFTEA